MSDGVLTTKDFMAQQQVKAGSVKAPLVEKNVAIEHMFKLPSAPRGKSQTVIKYKGKVKKIEMTDGVYTMPKQILKKERPRLSHALQESGFINVSRIKGVVKPLEENKTEKKYIYTVGHPDNTKDEKISGKVSIEINKKNRKFDCEDGIVSTSEKDVYDAFIKKGWYEVSIEEDKEEDKEEKK